MAEEEISEAPKSAPDDAEAPPPEEAVDPEACFESARARLDGGDTLEALALLERAHGVLPDDPRYGSWLGVLLVQERGQLKRGLELCVAAVEKDPSFPAHFYHLAKVYLRTGEKGKAIDVLRDGMRAHPDDEQLKGALVSLGIRKPPPFKSLERAHPLNKYTGILLTRLDLR